MEKVKTFLQNHPLVIVVGLLCFLSCFSILNAAPIIQKVANPQMLWSKQLVFYMIGIVIVFIINKVGNNQIYDKIWIIYWVLIALLVGLAIQHLCRKFFGFGPIPLAVEIGGATSWYRLPGLNLQPSEFMKIALIIVLARITDEYNDYILIRTFESEVQYLIRCAAVVILPVLLILIQNDTGVVLIILMGVLFVLFSSGLRGAWFTVGGILVGLVVVIGGYLLFFQPQIFSKIITGYKLNRFYGWIDPEGTIKNQGYQLFYSLLSYGTAGWFGHGFQQVVMQFPEPQTDFIFAVILTDYGYIGGILTIALIAALDIVILRIGFESSSARNKYFTMGIIGMLMFQQVWNMAMILGLLPITGITLPFISYGGSSLLSYMIAIGMFIDINDQNLIMKNRKY